MLIGPPHGTGPVPSGRGSGQAISGIGIGVRRSSWYASAAVTTG